MQRGCKTCEEWMEHCYWEHFRRSKRFLKTLTGDFSLRLSLPKKFTSYFKEEASQTVLLKGPAGDTWHVGIIETKGTLCLQNGWKEFVHAHHLRENDTLLFKYEGDSHFRVLMFDAGECEKGSTYFVKNKHSVEEHSGEMEHQDASEPDAPPLSPPCVDPPEEVSRPNKYQKREKVRSKRGEHNILSPKPEPEETSELEDRQGKGDSLPRRTKQWVNRAQRIAGSERGKALGLASEFLPSRPSFLLVMKPCNVHRTGYYLPRFEEDGGLERRGVVVGLFQPRTVQPVLNTEFSRLYLPKSNQEVCLRLPDGDTEWKVNYRIYRGLTHRFVGNWRNFSMDNCLEEGDVLVFELSEDHDQERCATMEVHIFRATD